MRGDTPLCTLSISRKKNLNSGLKVSQNSLKKIKAVIILSGEKMGKMRENWCVIAVTIAFCMNIVLFLGKKNHGSRYISVVRMKIHSNFLPFIMLRHKFALTCFRYLKNYH